LFCVCFAANKFCYLQTLLQAYGQRWPEGYAFGLKMLHKRKWRENGE